MRLIHALVSDLLDWLVLPIVTRFAGHVVDRIPRGPFLALTPARTEFGRSASVAVMLSGLIWIVAALSSEFSWWLTIAFVAAAVVAVGCGLAFATLWWPASLMATFLIMAIGLDWLPHLSPWSVRIGENTVHTLALGCFGVVLLAFVTSAVAIDQLTPRTPSKGAPNNPYGTLGKRRFNRSVGPDHRAKPD